MDTSSIIIICWFIFNVVIQIMWLQHNYVNIKRHTKLISDIAIPIIICNILFGTIVLLVLYGNELLTYFADMINSGDMLMYLLISMLGCIIGFEVAFYSDDK